jgi:hypothetical protein
MDLAAREDRGSRTAGEAGVVKVVVAEAQYCVVSLHLTLEAGQLIRVARRARQVGAAVDTADEIQF